MADNIPDKKIKEISETFAHDMSTPLLCINLYAKNLKQYLPILLEGHKQAIQQGHSVQEIPLRAQQHLAEIPNNIEESLDKMRAIINTFLAQLTNQSQYFSIKKAAPSMSSEVLPTPHQLQKQDRIIRILLADDEPINQQVAVDMLEILGCQVDSADNGQAAIDQWQAKSYDLILMDCRMPHLDGYQAASTIRQRESGTDKIPIIALTANVAEDERETCLQAGMDDLITKPLKLDKLRTALEKFIALP